jgi:arginyl-tRNA synthetase
MVDNIQIVEALNAVLTDLTLQEISEKLEAPKSSDLGDVAFPTFTLAKTLHKAPQLIAADIVAARLIKKDLKKLLLLGLMLTFSWTK